MIIYPKTFWQKFKWLVSFCFLIIQSCVSCPKEGIIFYKGELDPELPVEQFIIGIKYGYKMRNQISQEIPKDIYNKVKIGDSVYINCDNNFNQIEFKQQQNEK